MAIRDLAIGDGSRLLHAANRRFKIGYLKRHR